MRVGLVAFSVLCVAGAAVWVLWPGETVEDVGAVDRPTAGWSEAPPAAPVAPQAPRLEGASPEVVAERARRRLEERTPPPLAGLSVRGDAPFTVRGEDGEPLAGAGVLLVWERGDVRETVMSVVTGADGRWTPDPAGWGALPPVLREAGRWHLDVLAAGHAPYRVDLRPGQPPVRLSRGGSLTGRIVDAAGGAVPGARVMLHVGPKYDVLATRTDVQGRYVLGIPTPGPWRLVALEPHLGSTRRSLTLDPRRDVVAEDLVLGGDGVLEGRVVYPDGSPAVDAEVGASHERTRQGWSEVFQPEVTGLVSGRARTRADGRFRMVGLVPGRFALWVVRHVSDFPDWTSVHETGTTGIVLQAQPARLRVRVTDPEGRPVPGAQLKGTGFWYGPGSVVMRADGWVDAWAPPGAAVAVAARGGRGPWSEVALTMPRDRAETEVALVLRADSGERGSARVEVAADPGRPLGNVRVNLLAPRTRGWIAGGSGAAGANPLVFTDLPTGQALLRVEAGHGPGGTLQELENYWIPVEREVEIRAGETTPLAVDLRRGGRVRIDARLAEGVTAPRSLTAWLTPSGASQPLMMQWFVAVIDGKPQNSPAPAAGIPAVWRDLLAPGTYRVQVDLEGLKSAHADVEVRAGETVTATLTLERP